MRRTRYKKHSKSRKSRKSRKSYRRQRGGNNEQTTSSFFGVPINNKAVITVPGGSMSIKEYKEMIKNKSQSGISAYEYI